MFSASSTIITVLGALLATWVTVAEPQLFNNLQQSLNDRCGCGKMLYKPEREARRVKFLNTCLEKYNNGNLFPGVPALTNSCPASAIQALANLQTFARFMGRLNENDRKNVDICYYTLLGYRNKDGSANAEGIINDIEAGVKEDPGVISNALKDKMINLAKNVCDRADMKAFYKCVYQACFGRIRFPDI